ncbi:serine O-acetyltransferase [Pseudomonas sp. EA_15y_Pfl1_P104]|uniref:serine O-acetyltransferase n=1 Tax=Pseudomonas sp. EA_15y_Pfl1_P104 TaxID=3088686 RepID=UPI0030DA365E
MSLNYLWRDLKSISGSEQFGRILKSLVFDHSAHMVIVMRIGQSALKVPVFGRLLSFFIEYFIRIFFSSDISCRAKIGPGFCIMHGHDIVIGADVEMGSNCKIFNGVTLGNQDLSKSSKDNQPSLGNNVVICTGAKILGHISLGDNVVVGANSVVTKSFPANTIVVGVPGTPLKRNTTPE